MGQKIHPIGFRTGNFYDWKAKWFVSNREFKEALVNDITLRRAIEARLKNAGVTNILIDRLPKAIRIKIFVTRPGMVIGRGGSGIEDLKKFIFEQMQAVNGGTIVRNVKLDLDIQEVTEPDLSAHLVASRIASELERGLPARRVVVRAADRVMAAGALGVKIVLSGRIGGAEIARRQRYQTGSVPSQTLRANIDYAQISAMGKRGYIGVKVWIHRKES